MKLNTSKNLTNIVKSNLICWRSLPWAQCLIAYFDAAMLYTVSQKTRHQTLGHNFTNYYPIFKIFSIADSVVTLQQIRV